jgi:hypothetical protein
MDGWMDGWMGVKLGVTDCLAQSKSIKRGERGTTFHILIENVTKLIILEPVWFFRDSFLI